MRRHGGLPGSPDRWRGHRRGRPPGQPARRVPSGAAAARRSASAGGTIGSAPPATSSSGTSSSSRDDRGWAPSLAGQHRPSRATRRERLVPRAVRPSGTRSRRATRSRELGRDGLGDHGDDPRPRRRRTTPTGASGSDVGGGEPPVAERRRPRSIATMPPIDEPDERDPPDAALAEPRERAGDVLDLEQRRTWSGRRPSRRARGSRARGRSRSVAGTARAPRGRAPTEPRPAVEQEDRLARVGQPAAVAGARAGQPSAGEPRRRHARPQPDDLAAERGRSPAGAPSSLRQPCAARP